MLSRVAYFQRKAIASSSGMLRAHSAPCVGTGRARMLSTAKSNSAGAMGLLGGGLMTRRYVVKTGRNAFASGGVSTRGYGGSMYHFMLQRRRRAQ